MVMKMSKEKIERLKDIQCDLENLSEEVKEIIHNPKTNGLVKTFNKKVKSAVETLCLIIEGTELENET